MSRYESVLREDLAAAKLDARTARNGRRLLADHVDAALMGLSRWAHKDFSDRVPTGIPALDHKLGGGWKRGAMTLVGAVTGGGKTTLLQQFAMAGVMRGPVLFVSPEMDAEELAEREVIRRAEKSKWSRQHPNTADAALRAHELAGCELTGSKPPVYILDSTDITMLDVEAEAQDMARTCGLGMVCIDYAQEVADPDPRRPRYLTVGEVGARSVALARELRVPVLIASQVNVDEGKQGKRSYSYRESAILEQKSHFSLIFEVDWQEDGEWRQVKEARILARKCRGAAPFKLVVDYVPSLYLVREVGAAAEVSWIGKD